MRLRLPYPPSRNRYWRVTKTGRIYLSEEATLFKAQCRMAVLAQIRANARRPISGPVYFSASFYRPAKRGDLDNFSKVLLDALNGLAYLDDSQVAEIHLYRKEDAGNPRVEVVVRPVDADWPCERCRDTVENYVPENE